MNYTRDLAKLITHACTWGHDIYPLVTALTIGEKWEVMRQAAVLQKKLQPEYDILTLIDAWKMKLDLYEGTLES